MRSGDRCTRVVDETVYVPRLLCVRARSCVILQGASKQANVRLAEMANIRARERESRGPFGDKGRGLHTSSCEDPKDVIADVTACAPVRMSDASAALTRVAYNLRRPVAYPPNLYGALWRGNLFLTISSPFFVCVLCLFFLMYVLVACGMSEIYAVCTFFLLVRYLAKALRVTRLR